MTPLPRIMVAPNGARRGKADHPALPITDDELVDTTRACIAAGADGVHLHLRDGNGKHLLDAARYRFLLERLEAEVPGAYLQVTSEAAGIYDAPRAARNDARTQAALRFRRPARNGPSAG